MNSETKNEEQNLSNEIGKLIDNMEEKNNLTDKDSSYYFSDTPDEQTDTNSENTDKKSEQVKKDDSGSDSFNIEDKSNKPVDNDSESSEEPVLQKKEDYSDSAQENTYTEDNHFSEIFDNIKNQQHRERDIAREKRAKRIKKINDNRSEELTQKLKDASEIDDNLVFNDKTQKLEYVENPQHNVKNIPKDSSDTKKKSATKNKQHRYVFTNVINDQYESIVKIPATTFLPKENPRDDYKINLKYNPIKLLLAEISNDDTLKQEIEEENKEKKSASKKHQWNKLENAFFEESGEDVVEETTYLPQIDEYLSPDDAPHIEGMLFKSKYKLFVKTAVLFALFFISFIFVSIRRFSSPSDGIGNTIFYICTQFVPLIIASIVAKDTLINGIRGLVRLKGNADTAITFAVFASMIYSLFSLFQAQHFIDAKFHLYNVIPLLALFTNFLGKFDIVKRIFINFKFIKKPDEKYSIDLCNDKKFHEDIIKTPYSKHNECIAYQKGISFYNNFLKHSYQPDISEVLSGKIAIVSILASFAVFIITIFTSSDFLSALSSLSSVSSAFIPVFAMLIINMPLLKLCEKYIKKGVMIVNYYAVNILAKSKCAVFKASDLYYGKSISLHGVKMQNEYPSEKLMLELASIFKATSSNLYSPFLKIISGREYTLSEVSQYEYIDNKGIVAYINNKRFLVGNRNLLIKYSIKPPSQVTEEKYTHKNRFVTYVAVGSELCCMLILDYRPQPAVVDALQSMEDNNIKILITTTDPNIDAKMISSQFKVYYSSVKVLKSSTARFFDNAFSDKKEELESHAVTNGSTIQTAQVISSSIKMKNNINISIVAQILLAIVLACLVAIMNIRFGAGAINAFEFICCDVFCALVIFVLSYIRKI